MFYEGDLQSGISLAMQEAKLVGCFVTDDGDESNVWENEFLQEASLKSLLAEQTVLLRLVAGSQEAGYLAAIYPLPLTPTLVLINHGEVKEYITSGVSKEDFLKRLKVILEASRGPLPSTSGPAPSSPASSSANTPVSTHSATPAPPTDSPTPAAASTSTSSSTPTDTIPEPDSTPNQTARITAQTASIAATLSERSRRLEAQKLALDKAEKEKRLAAAKAKKEAAEAGNPKAVSERNYASQQAQRQREAREERARILKRVEDDKAERREREAVRRREVQARLEGEKGVVEEGGNASALPARGGANAKECAVQVRLFDGSTIRSRFPSTGSLLKDVRPWVDGKQEGDAPYTFKQVLSPLPNKNIGMSEEEHSFTKLGLTPSATLILVPVSDYTSAYEGGGGNIVSRAAYGGFGLLSSSVGLVTGALGSVFGGSAAPAPAPATQAPSAPAAPSASINVRTLRDHREESKKEDQQFYNGNATNFQPRKDDDERKDD